MQLFGKADIQKGDKVMVSSNLLKILISNRKLKNMFSPDTLLDELINKIGSEGTLIIPTFNWDFCKGKEFCYHRTMSLSGSLGNFALKRKDFSRTQNPIYSFAVTGKDKDLICSLEHKSCFGLDSPFGYLIKSNGKNLFIDIDYKDGFTLCHVAEETAGVDYRYLKKFSGSYRDREGKVFSKQVNMYVRDPKSKVTISFVIGFKYLLILNSSDSSSSLNFSTLLESSIIISTPLIIIKFDFNFVGVSDFWEVFPLVALF